MTNDFVAKWHGFERRFATLEAADNWIEKLDAIYEEDGPDAAESFAMNGFSLGDHVTAGQGDDEDEGRIEQLRGTEAFVAWQSGVKTWTPIDDLR